ncbi:MAG: holliday junction helicase RuvA, partial [Thermoleophilaceae bacterium]|nr:holliday junction helicase RuvA [Thermoleophilaceae bacterium]
AERIIVELREKVGESDGIVVTRSDDPRYMAREALMGLGFTIQEADRLLANAAGESTEELIEGALRARAAA